MIDLSLTVEENKTMYEGRPAHKYKGDVVSSIIMDMAMPYIKKASYTRFLDVGAGTGALIKDFRKRWCNVAKHIEGIDIVPKDAIVKKGDCTGLKYPNGSFDCVFCTDVIEHLRNKDLTLCIKEIKRVLRKGGLLFLTTINNEDLKQKIICCPECGRRFHSSGHCQVFTEKRIRSFLNRGFEVKKIKQLKLHFIAIFGVLARIFYVLRLHQIKPFRRITNDLFVVARKKGGK